MNFYRVGLGEQATYASAIRENYQVMRNPGYPSTR
jgi:hypothetical protein